MTRERAGSHVRGWALAAALLCVLGGCDESSGDAPDAGADADPGLSFGEACVRNPQCESRMCLVVPGASLGACTRACQSTSDCDAQPGWACGQVGGQAACVPPGPDADLEADADADADACPETATIVGAVTVYELIFPVAGYNRGNALAHIGRVSGEIETTDPDWKNDDCAAFIGQDLELEFAALPSLDAGPIRISGTLAAVTLTHDPFDKAYRSSLLADNANLFDAGRTIRVEAEGGVDVSGTVLEAISPAALRVTAPLNNASVSRATGLTVSWEPEGQGAVTVLLVAAVTTDDRVTGVTSIVCAAEDVDGQVAIPSAALALLPATASNAGFSVTRARGDSQLACEVALGLTVSTSFSGQVRLTP